MSKKRQKNRQKTSNGRRVALFAVIGGVLLLLIAGGLAISSMKNTGPSAPVDISQIPDEHDAQGLPYPDVPRISLEDARARFDAGSAIFVDVRSEDEYQARHIPGALSIPEEEIPDRYNELPKDQEIILYCT